MEKRIKDVAAREKYYNHKNRKIIVKSNKTIKTENVQPGL